MDRELLPPELERLSEVYEVPDSREEGDGAEETRGQVGIILATGEVVSGAVS